MGTFIAAREIPVWVGGLIGLFVMITIMSWFKRKPLTEAATTPQEEPINNPAHLVYFQLFATIFIAGALLQDFTTVFFPSFYIPLSAKYLMALCASLPMYISKRRS
jgi:hypothetical protein